MTTRRSLPLSLLQHEIIGVAPMKSRIETAEGVADVEFTSSDF